MRKIMLEDIINRFPEVLDNLRTKLAKLSKEEAVLKEKQRFTDPERLKLIVREILWTIENRINSYLYGDLNSAIRF